MPTPQAITIVKDWLRPHLRPRRFHAFVVGMPKTGTHSLAAVFNRYRAWHEPAIERFMHIIMARANDGMTNATALSHLRQLDRRMWLELNSSYVNYFLMDLLLEEYPRAKFLLTIRDCYSWLDSMFNQLLARSHGEYQTQFHKWYASTFAPGAHEAGDRVLAERGLWPLDPWLQAWSQHNSKVIDTVPKERLLVIRTQDIRRELPRLADFLEVPVETLDAGRSHEYTAQERYGLLAELDPGYLQERVGARCSELMQKYFPEVRSLADVPAYKPRDAAVSHDKTQ